MNIEEYNCLTPDVEKKPKYNPNPVFRCIKAYYAEDNDVIIVGEADPNYIYWLSVTKRDDEEINRMIFDYMSTLEPTVFGNIVTVLSTKTKYSYQQVINFYCTELHRSEDISLRYQNGKKRSKNSGTDKKLLATMRQQLKILSICTSDPIADYEKNKALIKRIQSQDYLRASDNPKVRELYNELDKCCSKLYNAYMTEAH